jgi:hypothetical protein
MKKTFYLLGLIFYGCGSLGAFAQSTVNTRSEKETYILNFGSVTCPEEANIAALADVEKSSALFTALHTKFIYQGRCTGKSSFAMEVVNIQQKRTATSQEKYVCFNMTMLGAPPMSKTNCALASHMKTLDELSRSRRGSHVVTAQNKGSTEADCTEGGHVSAYSSQKGPWLATNVFGVHVGDDVAIISRPSVKEALTDACRGLMK